MIEEELASYCSAASHPSLRLTEGWTMGARGGSAAAGAFPDLGSLASQHMLVDGRHRIELSTSMLSTTFPSRGKAALTDLVGGWSGPRPALLCKTLKLFLRSAYSSCVTRPASNVRLRDTEESRSLRKCCTTPAHPLQLGRP